MIRRVRSRLDSNFTLWVGFGSGCCLVGWVGHGFNLWYHQSFEHFHCQLKKHYCSYQTNGYERWNAAFKYFNSNNWRLLIVNTIINISLSRFALCFHFITYANYTCALVYVCVYMWHVHYHSDEIKPLKKCYLIW